MHSIITVRDVSFELPNGRLLIDKFNFTLDTGLTALVGPNGVGKSTLAQLLNGHLEPTAGHISRASSVTYFAQRETPPHVTVAEFVEWSEIGDTLLKDMDRSLYCDELSGGQWMRVRLARTVSEDFLILDEPTNDLDRDGRDALLDFLRGHRGGVLLISHDREALALADSILELSNRGLAKYGSGWTEYEKTKHAERSSAERDLDSAKRERTNAQSKRTEQIAKQDQRNRRGREAGERGSLPKILAGGRKRRAEGTTGRIDAETSERSQQKVRDAFQAFNDLKVEAVMYADLLGESLPSQKLVAEASNFNVRNQQGWLYPVDLNFAWRGPVRLAIKGPNGSGKSTLLNAIAGRNPREHRGDLKAGALRRLYIDQRSSHLDDDKTILENVQGHLSTTETRNKLAGFLFTKESVFQKVGTLSGGERLRVALAQGFLRDEKPPELLILDEPTNNLDLVNIEFLEGLVARFPGAVLAVSHDEVFLENCGLDQDYCMNGI